MKVWLFLAAVALGITNALPQGTLYFANLADGLDAQIRTPGCLAPVTADSRTVWRAELFYGPAGTPECLLQPFYPPGVVNAGSLLKNGYFNVGSLTINGFWPGEILAVQVRVWDLAVSSSWDGAVKVAGQTNMIGVSPVFEVALSYPWDQPHILTNLPPFCLCFPEFGNPSPVIRLFNTPTNKMVLAWQGGPHDAFKIQQASDLLSNRWNTLAVTPWTDWYNKQVAIATPTNTVFFRLIGN